MGRQRFGPGVGVVVSVTDSGIKVETLNRRYERLDLARRVRRVIDGPTRVGHAEARRAGGTLTGLAGSG